MAALADVFVVQPIPYLPGMRPLPGWARAKSRRLEGLEVLHAPMLYVPGALKSLDSMWLTRSIRASVERLHADRPLDLVDAHFAYPDGSGSATVARGLGLPYFITVRGFENEYVSRPLVGSTMLNAMRAATGCITVSHSLHALCVRHGVSEDRLRVVHNAIDGATFHHEDPSAARAKLDVGGARPLIISVGHLISRKRHHVLLDSFAALRKDYPNALLAILGARSSERSYPELLAEKCRQLGIAEHVRFVGSCPPAEVAVWLRAADVFALGTAREGCCNAVLEALGTGVPVVTTPAGDNTHFVRDDVNGFIIPIDDAPAFTTGIRRALARDWDQQGIARALYDQVGSWAGVGQRVIEFMNERLADEGAAGFRVALSARE